MSIRKAHHFMNPGKYRNHGIIKPNIDKSDDGFAGGSLDTQRTISAKERDISPPKRTNKLEFNTITGPTRFVSTGETTNSSASVSLGSGLEAINFKLGKAKKQPKARLVLD